MSDAAFVLESTARLAAPLVFVGMGELVAERAGAIDISVEGMMLGSAYAAALVSSATGSTLVGLVGGVLVALVIAFLQAVLSHRLSINQFVVGLVLNVLVLGVTSFLLAQVAMQPGRFATWRIPGLASVPLVGDALFNERAPFFLLYVLVPATWWLLYRTYWGLEVRAAGENPAAASESGVPVNRRRRQAIYLAGLTSGLAGAFLSIGVIGTFTQNMTASRGFIAIAAVIFGGWTIKGTIAGCLLFGAADALRLTVPALGISVNTQLLISAPYVLALLALLVFARRHRQPAYLGVGFQGAR